MNGLQHGSQAATTARRTLSPDPRLMALMAWLLVGLGACSGCDDGDQPLPTVPTVTFLDPSDGAALTPSDDVNGTLPGVQPRIRLEVTQIEQAVLTVNATSDPGGVGPDDTVEVSLAGPGEVLINELTISEGANRLRAELRGTNGVLLAATDLDLTLEIAALPPTISILAPGEGSVLDEDDDVDPDTDGVQFDVELTLERVEAGASLKLEIDGREVAQGQADGSERATFEAVTLPFGRSTLVATVEGDTGDDRDQVTIDVLERGRPCTLLLEPEASDALCDFGQDTDEDANRPGVQQTFVVVTDCEFVTLAIDGRQQAEVSARNGDATIQVTVPEGTFSVEVTAAGVDRQSASLSRDYTADAIAPTGAISAPANGAALSSLDDLDGDLDNGVNVDIVVDLDDADGALEVALEIDGRRVARQDVDGRQQITFEAVALSLGARTIEAVFFDGCGNSSRATSQVTVEGLVQALLIEAPQDGAVLGAEADLDPQAPGLQVIFNVSAQGLEPDALATIECRRQGSQAFFRRSQPTAFDQEAGLYAIAATLPDGAYTCRAASGAILSPELQLTVSLVLEAIEITAPDPDAQVNTPATRVTARVLNIANGQSVTLSIDSSDLTRRATVVDRGVVFNNIPLTEGPNTITLTANTAQAPSATTTITLDTVAPVITFTSPSAQDNLLDASDDANGDLDNGFQLAVTLNVAGVAEGTEVCVSADGRRPVCGPTDANGDATLPALMLAPGASTLAATTADLAGNAATANLSVTLAIDRPRVEIVAPTDGSALSQPVTSVTVASDLLEGTEVTLLVNGQEAATADADANGRATFADVALLADQDNTLQARGDDGRGLGVSPRISVLVDTTIPTVAFITPIDGQVFNLADADADGQPGFQTAVTLSAPGLADGRPASLTINCGGQPTTLNATVRAQTVRFSRVTLTDQATCALTAQVTNQADVSAQASISTRVDRQAPTLTPVRLRNGEVLNITDDEDPETPGLQRTIRVRFGGLEPGQSVSLTGGPIADEFIVEQLDGQATFGPVTLPEGELVLTFTASDVAGNTTSLTLELLIDSSDLALSFQNIDNPATLNASADVDPDTDGMQVELTVVGVRGLTGQEVRLCSNRAPQGAPACNGAGLGVVGQETLATELASALFVASLPEGTTRLVAEVDLDDDSVLTSEELLVTVDTVRPTIEALTLVNDTLEPAGLVGLPEDERPAQPGFTARFRIQAAGVTAGRTAQLLENGNVLAAGLVDAQGIVELVATFTDGPHTVSATVTDGAGNTVSPRPELTFTVDVTAPTLSFDNLVNDQPLAAANDLDPLTDDLQLNVVASSDNTGAEVTLWRVVGTLDPFDNPGDDQLLATGTVNEQGAVVFGGPVTLPQGAVTLALRTADAAGNVTDRAVAVTVDTIVPTVLILAPGNGTRFTEEPEAFRNRPGFQVEALIQSSEPGATVTVFNLDGGAAVSQPTTLDGNGVATVILTLDAGASTLEARVDDALGNTGASAPVEVTVELQGCGIAFSDPTISPLFVASDDDDDPANGVNISFTTVVADVQTCLGRDVQLFVDGVEVAATALGDDGQITFADVALSNDASHTVLAQIDDGQGNVSSTRALTIVVDLIAPTIQVVTPAADPARFGRAQDASSALAGLQTTVTLRVANANDGLLTITSSAAQQPIVQDRPITGADITLNNLTFPEGTQTVTIAVTDRAQTRVTATRTFEVDLTSPGAFEVLGAVTNPRLGTTDLAWIAPGDDGAQGFVERYEVRRALNPITDASFAQATLIEAFEPNVAPQQEENFQIESLPWTPAQGQTAITWHIAVRAFDDLGNASPVSADFTVTLSLDEARFKAAGSGDNFGFQTFSLGDINNDGRDDYLASELFGERAHVIYGQADPSTLQGNEVQTQALTVDDLTGFGFFGGRAAGLGDINGDGFNDFAVGAYFNNSFAGQVYLYFGSAMGQVSGQPDVVITGLASSQFGIAIAGLNFTDDDGEGINDVVIGANAEGGNTGAAYVVRGRAQWPEAITVSADEATNTANGVVRISGAAANSEFGYQLVGLSDLDDDGTEELAIGARRTDGGVGRVHVFFGGDDQELGAALSAAADSTAINAFDNGGLFGASMASGDLDGDGILDLVVGAYDAPDAIGVYLFTDAQIPSVASETWSFPTNRLYGEQLALADINGDGQLDIVAGGFADSGAGLLDVYFNDAGTFGGTADLRYSRGSNWGNDVAAGDFNGDGFDDLITDQHANAGAVIILY